MQISPHQRYLHVALTFILIYSTCITEQNNMNRSWHTLKSRFDWAPVQQDRNPSQSSSISKGSLQARLWNEPTPAGRSRLRSTISKAHLDRENTAAWLSRALLAEIELVRAPTANPARGRCALRSRGSTSHARLVWQILLAALTWGDEGSAAMPSCPTVSAQWRKGGLGFKLSVKSISLNKKTCSSRGDHMHHREP